MLVAFQLSNEVKEQVGIKLKRKEEKEDKDGKKEEEEEEVVVVKGKIQDHINSFAYRTRDLKRM